MVSSNRCLGLAAVSLFLIIFATLPGMFTPGAPSAESKCSPCIQKAEPSAVTVDHPDSQVDNENGERGRRELPRALARISTFERKTPVPPQGVARNNLQTATNTFTALWSAVPSRRPCPVAVVAKTAYWLHDDTIPNEGHGSYEHRQLKPPFGPSDLAHRRPRKLIVNHTRTAANTVPVVVCAPFEGRDAMATEFGAWYANGNMLPVLLSRAEDGDLPEAGRAIATFGVAIPWPLHRPAVDVCMEVAIKKSAKYMLLVDVDELLWIRREDGDLSAAIDEVFESALGTNRRRRPPPNAIAIATFESGGTEWAHIQLRRTQLERTLFLAGDVHGDFRGAFRVGAPVSTSASFALPLQIRLAKYRFRDQYAVLDHYLRHPPAHLFVGTTDIDLPKHRCTGVPVVDPVIRKFVLDNSDEQQRKMEDQGTTKFDLFLRQAHARLLWALGLPRREKRFLGDVVPPIKHRALGLKIIGHDNHDGPVPVERWSHPRPEPAAMITDAGVEAVLQAFKTCASKSGRAVAFCGVVRNRAKLTQEWVAWHAMMGVTHFYIYDDDSTDGLTAALGPFVRRGIVTLMGGIPDPPHRYNGRPARSGMWHAYGACEKVADARGFEWVGHFDSDEFLISRDGMCIPEHIDDILAKRHLVGGIAFRMHDVAPLPTNIVDDAPTEFVRTNFSLGAPGVHGKMMVRVGGTDKMISAHYFQPRSSLHPVFADASEVPGDQRCGCRYHGESPGGLLLLHYSIRSMASYVQRYLDGVLNQDQDLEKLKVNYDTIIDRFLSTQHWARGTNIEPYVRELDTVLQKVFSHEVRHETNRSST